MEDQATSQAVENWLCQDNVKILGFFVETILKRQNIEEVGRVSGWGITLYS